MTIWDWLGQGLGFMEHYLEVFGWLADISGIFLI